MEDATLIKSPRNWSVTWTMSVNSCKMIADSQTSQLSQFGRVTHDFDHFLAISRLTLYMS